MSAQTWNVNTNGAWGTAGNWTPGSVPNAVDATATLGSVITANRTVTIASPVTLGTLNFNDNNRYTVTGSTVTFDVTAGSAAINSSGAGGGGTGHALASALSLNDNLVVTQAATGTLDITGSIANNGKSITVNAANTVRFDGAVSGAGGFVKNGTSSVVMGGAAANTFAGDTLVSNGTLSLSKTAGITSIAGNLAIGDGLGVANSALVTVVNNNQIANTSNVTIASDGRLTLNASRTDTIGALNATSGTASVVLSTGSALSVGSGSAPAGTFAGLISGAGALLKTGTGTLTLSGGGSNTYSGTTTVSAGTLALAKTAGQNAVGAGAVLLNSGGTLLLENANQIGNTTAMTLAGGTFSTGTGFSETLGVLTLTSDSNLTLGSSLHNLHFGASNLASWSPTATLTIYGWSGTGGLSGIAGQVFFGAGSTALTLAQLSQISFNGYSGSQLLSTGELVPMAVPEIQSLFAALLLGALILWRERRSLSLPRRAEAI